MCHGAASSPDEKHELLEYITARHHAQHFPSFILLHLGVISGLSRQKGHDSHNEIEHHVHNCHDHIAGCRKAPVGAADGG